MKIVLWILFIVAVLFALRLLNVAKTKRRASGQGASAPPAAETMVRCACCGVYLPRKDATPGPAGLTCGEPACTKPR